MEPTAQLPPIRNITSASCQDIAKALEYIRNVYQPRVRGSRRRRSSPSAKHATEAYERKLGHLDPFERNYTTKWLGALISHLELRHFSFPDSDTENLIQSAASLVALCSGTAAAGTLYRDFTFQSNHVPISVRIKDIPLNNHDYSSVGAQTWGGACVLAEMIAVEPWKFGFCHPDSAASLQAPVDDAPPTIAPLHPLRILELGAGTGLVSLTTAKVIETLMSTYHVPSMNPMPNVDTSKQRSTALVTIVATDYYSPVLDNLDSNIAANIPKSTDSLVSITSHQLDWAHFSATYGPSSASSPPVLPAPFDEPFDVILGADIVYELEHAAWIKSCLSILLRGSNSQSVSDVSHMQHLSPSTDRFTDNVFHLVIPLRPTHDKESQTIETIFPYSESFQDMHYVLVPRDEKQVEDDLLQTESFTTTTQQLCILSREVIICEKEDGEMVTDGDDENGVTYVYYRIGWSNSK